MFDLLTEGKIIWTCLNGKQFLVTSLRMNECGFALFRFHCREVGYYFRKRSFSHTLERCSFTANFEEFVQERYFISCYVTSSFSLNDLFTNYILISRRILPCLTADITRHLFGRSLEVNHDIWYVILVTTSSRECLFLNSTIYGNSWEHFA